MGCLTGKGDEMSEPEFPRYFTNVAGFGDGTLFVRMDDENERAHVFCDGSVGFPFSWPLDDALSLVKRGVWIEVPRREAEDEIRKARGEE